MMMFILGLGIGIVIGVIGYITLFVLKMNNFYR